VFELKQRRDRPGGDRQLCSWQRRLRSWM